MFIMCLFNKLNNKRLMNTWKDKTSKFIAVKVAEGCTGAFDVISTSDLMVKVTIHDKCECVIVTYMEKSLSKAGKPVWAWTKYEYMNKEFNEIPKHGVMPYEWFNK